MTTTATPRPPRPAAGFVLLEVLIALLIFAVGVLGIVGLQAAMTKAQTSSKLRIEAAYLAQEFLGTMWSDTGNITSYSNSGCSGNTRCNAILTKVQTNLPSGTVDFRSDSAPGSPGPSVDGSVVISISWTPVGESTHTYTTGTQISP